MFTFKCFYFIFWGLWAIVATGERLLEFVTEFIITKALAIISILLCAFPIASFLPSAATFTYDMILSFFFNFLLLESV